MSRSASWAAALSLASGAEDADQLVHAATSYAGEALSRVAAETVQLHGGIAITWEHDAHLVFKRAHALAHLFGTPSEHRALLTLP
jgi:alkylation response protein AidB-like acyl-CoA dehydrogenase